MGRPDHLICLLRNLYAGQEATVRLDVEQPRARVVWAGRLHAPCSVAEALRAHASVICLQHPSLPPHSAAEQVSLN